MNQRIKVKRRPGRLSVDAQIVWMMAQEQKTKRFVAICPMLNIVLEGDTREELFGLIPESTQSLFLSLTKHNDWDEFLRDTKWTKSQRAVFQQVRKQPSIWPTISVAQVPPNDLQLAACG